MNNQRDNTVRFFDSANSLVDRLMLKGRRHSKSESCRVVCRHRDHLSVMLIGKPYLAVIASSDR